ncbi:hypothetical protein MSG28_001670 [Choristoneura fumiferana]|uniref:Uncharacterized protein n=1 Tax=Choristoneura fumiferana TaxID=7141 RepID=A0ACC0KVY6_CHOFU|nr:hypothetical protein MSG28_001670 [Choristoneura fumiferana]
MRFGQGPGNASRVACSCTEYHESAGAERSPAPRDITYNKNLELPTDEATARRRSRELFDVVLFVAVVVRAGSTRRGARAAAGSPPSARLEPALVVLVVAVAVAGTVLVLVAGVAVAVVVVATAAVVVLAMSRVAVTVLPALIAVLVVALVLAVPAAVAVVLPEAAATAVAVRGAPAAAATVPSESVLSVSLALGFALAALLSFGALLPLVIVFVVYWRGRLVILGLGFELGRKLRRLRRGLWRCVRQRVGRTVRRRQRRGEGSSEWRGERHGCERVLRVLEMRRQRQRTGLRHADEVLVGEGLSRDGAWRRRLRQHRRLRRARGAINFGFLKKEEVLDGPLLGILLGEVGVLDLLEGNGRQRAQRVGGRGHDSGRGRRGQRGRDRVRHVGLGRWLRHFLHFFLYNHNLLYDFRVAHLRQAVQDEKNLADFVGVSCIADPAINQVTLLGRVGADPQKRGTEAHPVVNFPLATHFNYKYESGDMLHRTDWHRVSVFRPGLRDTVYKYLKKGQRVYVTGKLSYGEIKSDDGQVRTASTVIADDIIFFQGQLTHDET